MGNVSTAGLGAEGVCFLYAMENCNFKIHSNNIFRLFLSPLSAWDLIVKFCEGSPVVCWLLCTFVVEGWKLQPYLLI
jgi:hypothetical protein